MKKKFIVVGSEYYRDHNGHAFYFPIKNLGIFNDQNEAEKCLLANYDDCGGQVAMFEVMFEEN